VRPGASLHAPPERRCHQPEDDELERAAASVRVTLEGGKASVRGGGAAALEVGACRAASIKAQAEASASIEVSVKASASASGGA
jgi:lysine/ornithine N-monooxygenase